MPRIIGYQVSNQVTVRQRNLAQFGRMIDTLVSAGANQVNGPSFQMDEPDAALDEARVEAMKKARARAKLYASAAGLQVSADPLVSARAAAMRRSRGDGCPRGDGDMGGARRRWRRAKWRCK